MWKFITASTDGATVVPITSSRPRSSASNRKPEPSATSRIGLAEGALRIDSRSRPRRRGERIQVSSRKNRISSAVTARMAAKTRSGGASTSIEWIS